MGYSVARAEAAAIQEEANRLREKLKAAAGQRVSQEPVGRMNPLPLVQALGHKSAERDAQGAYKCDHFARRRSSIKERIYP